MGGVIVYATIAANGTPSYHYYLWNHLGNVRVVFNQSGTVGGHRSFPESLKNTSNMEKHHCFKETVTCSFRPQWSSEEIKQLEIYPKKTVKKMEKERKKRNKP